MYINLYLFGEECELHHFKTYDAAMEHMEEIMEDRYDPDYVEAFIFKVIKGTSELECIFSYDEEEGEDEV